MSDVYLHKAETIHVLCLCNWGENRSQYLAQYLRAKGYDTDFAGVADGATRKITNTMVRRADVIIFTRPGLQELFLQRFSSHHAQLIQLNVEDRTAVLVPGVQWLDDEAWRKLQKECVYPELERQIVPHLPFKSMR